MTDAENTKINKALAYLQSTCILWRVKINGNEREKIQNVRVLKAQTHWNFIVETTTSITTSDTISPDCVFNLSLYLEKQPPWIQLNLQGESLYLIVLVFSVSIWRTGCNWNLQLWIEWVATLNLKIKKLKHRKI